VILGMLVMGVVGVARLVLAADSATYSIDIPVQGLGTALLKFATFTHQQIAFDQKLVEGYDSSALSGTYTVVGGLHALINTAPFQISTTPSGVLTVTPTPVVRVDGDARAAAEQSPARSAVSSAGTSVLASQYPPEVVVRARRRALRAELAPKVSAFVYGIAFLERGYGLARWERPLCPLVSGLTREEGEFILARVSEIAHSIGVELAGENCRRPNLYILVTTRPKELLQGMEKRNRIFTFGVDALPAVIDEFIDTPRPVRAWYSTNMSDAWGLPPAIENPGSSGSFRVVSKANSSHLISNVVYKFTRVFVIIDATRLQGVSRGQLADYVGLVGLAQFKSTPHLGDVQTILRLFDGKPQAAPAGMSDWDMAYLKSLYGIGESLAKPRALLSRLMLDEMIP
jgi:hypothetical protein